MGIGGIRAAGSARVAPVDLPYERRSLGISGAGTHPPGDAREEAQLPAGQGNYGC